MAAKGSAVNSLQEEVTCSVCQEIYNQEKLPKKLSCDHIFCLQCLQELIARSLNTNLVCPVCRATSPLQESDASQYPTARHVYRLLDIYHQTLKEQAQESPAASESTKYLTCSSHSSQPLALFCETCQETVCRDCALFLCAPNKHKYSFLEQVVKKYKTELDDKVQKPLSELYEQVVETAKAIETDNDMLEKEKKDELAKIDVTFEMLSLNISDQKKKLVSEMEKHYEIQSARNILKVSELEEASLNLSSAMQTVKDMDILTLATNKSLLSLHKKQLEALQCQSKELLNCHPRNSTGPFMKLEYQPFEFDPRSLLFYVGKDFKCRLTEYDCLKNLRLKQPFQLEFQLTKLKNEAKIKSKLICLHDKSSVSVNIIKTSPNNISLSATPQNRGRHELHVTACDSHICGSPIPAFVFFEPHQLPLGRSKSITVEDAHAIKCNDGNIMVSSDLSALSTLEYKNQSLTITKRISCPGIAEFATHNNCLYYSDVLHNRLVKADINGRILARTGEKGFLPGQFDFPNGVSIHKDQIFVCDSENGRIQVFDTDLDLVKGIGEKGDGPGQFSSPNDLVFDESGNMYVLENQNDRVQVLTPQGNHIQFIGIRRPVSLALYNGHIFITNANRISVYTLTGKLVTSFSGESGTECIDIDANGFIYITSSRKNIYRY